MSAPKQSASGRVTLPQDKSPTSISEWKSQAGRTLLLPSGKRALLRNPGLPAFIKSGLIPNALLPIVLEALREKKSPDMSALNMDDMEKVISMIELMDNVAVACFVDPSLSEVPEDPKDREEDVLYVDEIDAQDKAFVMQWAVGGTSDLKKFREQLAGSMGTVQSGKALASPTKRPAKRR